jgi:threonylcarbamoyladenosine tRNA methylthiotransferase MtaB
MPQVRGPVVQARAARLREAGAMLRRRWLASHIGRAASVVVERNGASHTEDYAPVRLADGHPVGSILATQISALDGDTLIGEAA